MGDSLQQEYWMIYRCGREAYPTHFAREAEAWSYIDHYASFEKHEYEVRKVVVYVSDPLPRPEPREYVLLYQEMGSKGWRVYGSKLKTRREAEVMVAEGGGSWKMRKVDPPDACH